MSFLIFAWIGLLGYSICQIFEKLTSKYLITNPWLFNFVSNFFALFLIVPITLVHGLGTINNWPFVILAALFWALGNVFFFLALFSVDISVISPAFSVKTALVLLLGFLFLGEHLTRSQSILILIILLASLFIGYDEKFKMRSLLTKAMLFVFLDMIVLALETLFVNRALQTNDFWTMTFWYQLLTVAFLLPTFPLFKKELRSICAKPLVVVFFIVILSTLGLVATNYAYGFNIGITSIIGTIPMSMIFAVTLSVFAPKLLEKHTLKVYLIRFASALVMLLAAIKLTLN
jgi:drug/metabolite transporter (DMT)-like permease